MTPIDLTPLVDQVVLPILAPVLVVAITWAAKRVADFFHIQLQDSQRRMLESAMQSALAFAEAEIRGRTVQVSASDKVAVAVDYLLPKVPAALASLGIDKDHLADMLKARLAQ